MKRIIAITYILEIMTLSTLRLGKLKLIYYFHYCIVVLDSEQNYKSVDFTKIRF